MMGRANYNLRQRLHHLPIHGSPHEEQILFPATPRQHPNLTLPPPQPRGLRRLNESLALPPLNVQEATKDHLESDLFGLDKIVGLPFKSSRNIFQDYQSKTQPRKHQVVVKKRRPEGEGDEKGLKNQASEDRSLSLKRALQDYARPFNLFKLRLRKQPKRGVAQDSDMMLLSI
jgi:hypothetical protein